MLLTKRIETGLEKQRRAICINSLLLMVVYNITPALLSILNIYTNKATTDLLEQGFINLFLQKKQNLVFLATSHSQLFIKFGHTMCILFPKFKIGDFYENEDYVSEFLFNKTTDCFIKDNEEYLESLLRPMEEKLQDPKFLNLFLENASELNDITFAFGKLQKGYSQHFYTYAI